MMMQIWIWCFSIFVTWHKYQNLLELNTINALIGRGDYADVGSQWYRAAELAEVGAYLSSKDNGYNAWGLLTY